MDQLFPAYPHRERQSRWAGLQLRATGKQDALEKAADERKAAAKEKSAKEKEQVARQEAQKAKASAVAKSEEIRKFPSKQYVQRGSRALDDNDYSLGLLWFVQALKLDAGDADRERDHRLRVANTWMHMPRITAMFFHDGPIKHAEPSPDGKRIVSASYDDTARIWNVETGAPQGIVLKHDGYVYDACFSPDGRYVATASADGTARVWDAQTGQPVTPPLQHGFAVSDVEFSPDSTRVATACGGPNDLAPPPRGVDSQRHIARDPARPLSAIWDIATLSCVKIDQTPNDSPLWIRFDPTGQLVTTCRQMDDTTVYDAKTGIVLHGPLHHGEIVWGGQFSADGSQLITRSYSGNTRVWNLEKATQIGKPIPFVNLRINRLIAIISRCTCGL